MAKPPPVQMVVLTDGRLDCLERTLASFEDNLVGGYDVTIVNDSPDQAYASYLRRKYAGWAKIINHYTRLGFAAAIQSAWKSLPMNTEYVFHLEDDFELVERVDLETLMYLLQAYPELCQVALKRQAWNAEEKAAGGICELHPEDFERVDTAWGPITTHRRFFTTNPSLYPAWVVERGWPSGRQSEGRFSVELFAERPQARSAFLGAPTDPPKVLHIGAERIGVGY